MAKKKKDSEEKTEVNEDVMIDNTPVEIEQPHAVTGAEDEFTAEDEAKFALPMAPIVRMMKVELDKDKMIRKRVKEEMNLWLEKICRDIAKRMNQSEYTVVEIADFRTAIEPYEMINDVEGERQRIVATMEKIKQDCDSLIRDVNRKFIAPEQITNEKPPVEGA